MELPCSPSKTLSRDALPHAALTENGMRLGSRSNQRPAGIEFIPMEYGNIGQRVGQPSPLIAFEFDGATLILKPFEDQENSFTLSVGRKSCRIFRIRDSDVQDFNVISRE